MSPSELPEAPAVLAARLYELDGVEVERDAQGRCVAQEASDLSIFSVDAWCCAGRFGDVAELLDMIDTDRLHPAAIMGLMSISYHAKHEPALARRPAFVQRAVRTLHAKIGPERTLKCAARLA